MTGIEYRPIESLLHPTDFSKAGQVAFIHALKIALCNQSHFDILHVNSIDSKGARWAKFPQVRQTLEHWKLLKEGSSKQAVGDELGLKVRKLDLPNKKPVPAMLEYFEREECDLIVLSTEGRSGLPRWLMSSISESLARSAGIATLFVPQDSHGFVSGETGEVDLKRVLIPVDHKPNPQAAIESVGGFLRSIDAKAARLDVFYVGDTSSMPEVEQPSDIEAPFEQIVRRGSPVDEILKMAKEQRTDLIVMATEGHNGFLDALRGSTTEQVLRQSPCPVLAIPPGT